MKKPWIAIAGRKGGSGKTSLALGLAAHYARAGRRVLLTDLDVQGSASLALDADASGADLATCLQNGHAPEPLPVLDNLALLPGGPELELLSAPRPLRDALGSLPFDVFLFDCPPGHAALDCLALEAADVVLAVCEPHRLGVAGAARVLDAAKDLRPDARAAVVVGRLDERRGLDRTAPDLLAGAFGLPVFPVRQDAALAGALNAGQLPPAHGRAADDVGTIAAWIEGRKKA